MPEVIVSDQSIPCADKVVLAGSLFLPAACKAAVMLAPATGIRRRYYTSFASYLAQHEYAVLTYDNRGIGDSLSEKIADSKVLLQDWGQKDMPAVLQHLKQAVPDVPCHLIGHSAGGQLVGLMHNSSELSSLFNVASSSGNISAMKYPFKFTAHFYLGVFIPLCNALLGYTPSKWVGMGESLPKGVARQWAEWCYASGYVASALDREIKEHWYNELKLSAHWLSASDDQIANRVNVEEMVAVFSALDSTIEILEPEDYGFEAIGHMGFFRKHYAKLWPLALNWLNSRC